MCVCVVCVCVCVCDVVASLVWVRSLGSRGSADIGQLVHVFTLHPLLISAHSAHLSTLPAQPKQFRHTSSQLGQAAGNGDFLQSMDTTVAVGAPESGGGAEVEQMDTAVPVGVLCVRVCLAVLVCACVCSVCVLPGCVRGVQDGNVPLGTCCPR